jgi:hypothetical protein
MSLGRRARLTFQQQSASGGARQSSRATLQDLGRTWVNDQVADTISLGHLHMVQVSTGIGVRELQGQQALPRDRIATPSFISRTSHFWRLMSEFACRVPRECCTNAMWQCCFETRRLRAGGTSTTSSGQVVLAAECKFYSVPIPLRLARAFVGLVSDLGAGKDRLLVVRSTPRSQMDREGRAGSRFHASMAPLSRLPGVGLAVVPKPASKSAPGPAEPPLVLAAL